MKKKFLVFVLVYLFCGLFSAGAQEFNWENVGGQIFDCSAVQAGNDRTVFAAGGQNLFKSEDGGKNWRRVFCAGTKLARIYAIVRAPQAVFTASSNGLYRSLNNGRNWEKVFGGKNSGERLCQAVLVQEQAIFLGTADGLFVSRDNLRSWNKYLTGSSVSAISCSAGAAPVIYLAAAQGVFRSTDQKSWEKVFTVPAGDDPELPPQEETEEEPFKINDIKADPQEAGLVYFSSSRGVYLSRNQGQSWEKLPQYGLLNRNVKRLSISSSLGLLALCDNGIFVYTGSRWTEISFGLPAFKLNDLCLDNSNHIYTAGKNGIFRSGLADGGRLKQNIIFEDYIRFEPDIQKVQAAAVKYAEVDPEKISRWRKAAAKRALLPQVSVGLERNSTDLWHWEGGSTTKSEDDCLRRGRDTVDWDISLSWNLSDIFYNDAQTSIDARSKLMVELRNDILDQVNKLYFERLRLRSELDSLAIEDAKRRLEKQWKLAEITASLDALTAGYYSRELSLIASSKA